MVGCQPRHGNTRLDVYILVGMLLPMETDVEYTYLIAQEFDFFLARRSTSLNISPGQCVFIEQQMDTPEIKDMVHLCMAIVEDMEDVTTSGISVMY